MKRVRFALAGLIVASALGACLPGDPLCPPSDPDQPVRVPAVDASGASDVSGPMAEFLATVPDGSTIELRAGGTYRMEEGFSIAGRCNLTIRGNGATFVATSTGVSTRVSVRIEDSGGISVFNLRVVGANPMAGAKDDIFRPELAGQHGFGISRSTNVRLSGVSVTDTYGDFVYMGRWGGDAYTDGVLIEGSIFARSGRQGITLTGARNVLVETSIIIEAKRSTFDLEPGAGAASTVENVIIRNNVISNGALSFVSAEGHGPVDHITIQGNQVLGMPLSITVEDLDAGLRQDWKVLDNTSNLPAGGAEGATMRFVLIDGLEVHGNLQPMKPDREMYLVGATNSCNLSVSGNTIPNGVGELRTTGTCP
ncbi:MAG: right-handed parallel beta-helix repeat-containing protein [Acidimicrobiales bacterium]